MKKIIAGLVLISASTVANAGAAGGDGGCGWGNALFKGQSGMPSHVIAGITNVTFGKSFYVQFLN